DERIVSGDAVLLAVDWTIDVDSQNFRRGLRQVLAAEVSVGVAGAVAGGDVEHSVEAELRIAAVMSVRFPGDDFEGRLGIERVRRAVHCVAGDDRTFWSAANRAVPADVQVAVVGEA